MKVPPAQLYSTIAKKRTMRILVDEEAALLSSLAKLFKAKKEMLEVRQSVPVVPTIDQQNLSSEQLESLKQTFVDQKQGLYSKQNLVNLEYIEEALGTQSLAVDFLVPDDDKNMPDVNKDPVQAVTAQLTRKLGDTISETQQKIQQTKNDLPPDSLNVQIN